MMRTPFLSRFFFSFLFLHSFWGRRRETVQEIERMENVENFVIFYKEIAHNFSLEFCAYEYEDKCWDTHRIHLKKRDNRFTNFHLCAINTNKADRHRKERFNFRAFLISIVVSVCVSVCVLYIENVFHVKTHYETRYTTENPPAFTIFPIVCVFLSHNPSF